MTQNQRQSNIELLRCFAMLCIIVYHLCLFALGGVPTSTKLYQALQIPPTHRSTVVCAYQWILWHSLLSERFYAPKDTSTSFRLQSYQCSSIIRAE